MFRDEDDANDDPDYQQPASVSQKDDDLDDEDDKVAARSSTTIFPFHIFIHSFMPSTFLVNEVTNMLYLYFRTLSLLYLLLELLVRLTRWPKVRMDALYLFCIEEGCFSWQGSKLTKKSSRILRQDRKI